MSQRIKDLATENRPQERLEKKGAQALSDAELLAMILRTGIQGTNVVELSHSLISKAGSLTKLIRWDHRDFLQVKGIGKVKALQLAAVVEIARRVLNQDNSAIDPKMDSAESVYQYMYPIAAGLNVEKFWTLSLNRKNRIIKCQENTSGTATSSLVHPREVLKEAILNNATALIVAHNHPSGDPTPSQADIKVTKTLQEACKAINIDLLDHVIIGEKNQSSSFPSGYYSFSDSGLL
jgi:DNA repair protein RadC